MLFCDCGCKVTTIFYITKIFQEYFVDYFEKLIGNSALIFSSRMMSDRKILSFELFESIGLCVVLPVYLLSLVL